MANTIQIKRGLKANLPAQLEPGELAVTMDASGSDSYVLYVGATDKSVQPVKAAASGTVDKASKLATARNIALSGDATGNVDFDGSANVTIATTLADSGVTAGQYAKVTVDSKGRVTAGTTLVASDIPELAQSKITNLTTDLGNKADKATTLSGYGITDAYTKTEVDAKLVAVYKYKGSVATYSDLPTLTTEPTMVTGWVYNVQDTGDNYAAIVEGDPKTLTWDRLGITIDLSNYYTKTEVDTALNGKVDKVTGKGLSTEDFTSALKTKLEGIAEGAEVNYVKSVASGELEVSAGGQLSVTAIAQSKVTGLSTALDGKVDKVEGKGLSTEDYTTAEKTKLSGIAAGAQVNVIETVKVNGTALTVTDKAVNVDISGKADKATTLAGYGITDAYTKTEIAALTIDGGTF